MEYTAYWNLTAPPFENVPDPTFYFPSEKHEGARQRLLYGVKAKKGIVMLTGDLGCGKTLISRALLQALPSPDYDIGLVVNPALPFMDFLAEVLYQFGLDSTGTKVQLIHRVNDRLLANHHQKRSTVLVVDEAQSIQDDRIFEDLRLLLNFQLNHDFLMTMVLLGQPELKERVQANPQLSQRIGLRYHLAPLTAEETHQYIRFRIRIAGGDPNVFSNEAVSVIFRQSGGVSRLINALCDTCLFLGAQDRRSQIDLATAEQATLAVI